MVMESLIWSFMVCKILCGLVWLSIVYGWCYLSDHGPTNNLLFVGRGPTNNLLFVVLANIHFDKIELEQICKRLRAQKGNQTNS